MANEKVVSMANVKGNSRLWTAEQCLEELLREISAGKVKPEKMLVLFWEDVGAGHLRRSERCVNFTNVEHIAFMSEALHSAIDRWKDPK